VDLKTFGSMLRNLRNGVGRNESCQPVTLEALAIELGDPINISTIHRIEKGKGKQPPPEYYIERFCRSKKLSLTYAERHAITVAYDSLLTTPRPNASALASTKSKDRVEVYRWYHKEHQDHALFVKGKPTDNTLLSLGYNEPEFMGYGWTSRFDDAIAIYRWWHERECDWVTVLEGNHKYADLERAGYSSKTFLFYATRNQFRGSVGICRWRDNKNRDWVDVIDRMESDSELYDKGLRDKHDVFYILRSIDDAVEEADEE